MSKLESIRYSRGQLQLLDQKQLPNTMHYDQISTAEEGWAAIREMRVRGAPAIAIAAVLSVAVEVSAMTWESTAAAKEHITKRLIHLKSSRPTAVDLFNAVDMMTTFVAGVAAESGEALALAYIERAEAMLKKDVENNMAIGRYGADLFSGEGLRVVTHCNTGSLATAKYGTALGVIRALHEGGRLAHAYCTETRPYNQGARLTAFELVYEKIPSTLICDSMAAALMRDKGINGVVVGADRVVANGDFANKIGTYQLAIVCQFHKVPFYCAAPTTSIDMKLATGSDITIEERPEEELFVVQGQRVAAPGIGGWNPAFDVTPASLVTAIITELGVVYPQNGTFDLAGFLAAH